MGTVQLGLSSRGSGDVTVKILPAAKRSLHILLFRMVSETSSERGSDEEVAIESLYEQDFQALREECLRTNTLFTDPEFLPREEFLRERSKQYGNDVVWLRPSDLCRPEMPILVSNKNEGFDIKHGLDSWFVPAFSAIADSTALLNHVIPPDQVDPGTLLIFHFCISLSCRASHSMSTTLASSTFDSGLVAG